MDHSLPNKLPLVSIGIPTYNGALRIEKALKSVQDQPYHNVEIIISDNGSTDHTEEVCRSHAALDPRIRYYRHDKNQGLSFNFGYVLKEARGEYFIWLSDDDHLLPEILGSYVDFLEKNQDYSLVCGVIDYWDGDMNLTDREENLSFEQAAPLSRTVQYYTKVKEGALIYGLMRRAQANGIAFQSILGCDWHFVAALAYLGKIKQMNFTGYNKYIGGLSRNKQHFARIMGEAPIWGYMPHTKMALDAFREIVWKAPAFRKSSFPARLVAGTISAIGIWGHYNVFILPRILGGKVLRLLRIKTFKERKLEAMSQGS